MKRINSLSDLLMEELGDLLSSENQLIEALPKIAEATQSSELKAALEDHLEVKKDQAGRLLDIFSNIGINPHRVSCKAMKRFIEESREIVNRTEKGLARDTAIIGVAQEMENYEIAGYKTACEHADDLGHTRIVELLDKTLNEERTVKFRLSEFAQSMINIQAIDPKGHHQQQDQSQGYSLEENSKGFYVPEKKFTRRGNSKRFKDIKNKSGQEENHEKQ